VNILLDTHALLWWVAGSKIADQAGELLSDPDNLIFVSAASIWEISIKQSLGKLTVEGDLDAVVAEDFESLDIGFGHARLAGQLPAHHRDPFDRLLISQAKMENLSIMTRDRVFAEYDLAIVAI